MFTKFHVESCVKVLLGGCPKGQAPLTKMDTIPIDVELFKGSIFLKNRHFIIQERFNKLIYGMNTIIKCGT